MVGLVAGCTGAPSTPVIVDAAVTDTPAPDRAPLDVLASDRTMASDDAPSDLGLPDGPSVAPDALAADTPAPPVDAPAPPLFDLSLIRDPATADCAYDAPRTVLRDGVPVQVTPMRYRSWESVDGVLVPITIRAYAARRADASGALPGVVLAHGLGGSSDQGQAAGLAARIGTVVIAYTGPGGGTTPENTSEGHGAGAAMGYRLFDVTRDPRGTWFWGHIVAAMRGLTCLEARPDVDRRRLGVTGFSAGGVATLVTAGVDDRVRAAVPLSGTLAWDRATRSPNAWQHALLRLAGLTTASPEWSRLLDTVASLDRVRGTSAQVLMVDGTTDEFFPLTAFDATWEALPADRRRISLAANFDHGCFALSGIEPRANIEERADLRAGGAQRMWFGHWFGTDPDVARVPAQPTMTVTPVGPGSLVAAAVDESVGSLDVEQVKVWWSGDRAFAFGSVDLRRTAPGVWGAATAFGVSDDSVMYVDVQYRSRALLDPLRFSLSSRPMLAASLVPTIRRQDSCTP